MNSSLLALASYKSSTVLIPINLKDSGERNFFVDVVRFFACWLCKFWWDESLTSTEESIGPSNPNFNEEGEEVWLAGRIAPNESFCFTCFLHAFEMADGATNALETTNRVVNMVIVTKRFMPRCKVLIL